MSEVISKKAPKPPKPLKPRPLNLEEREVYEQAIHFEGKAWKRSHSMMVGFQERYLKVIAQGDYLAYYNEKPPS
jgi:hypothetical protein